MLLVRNVFYCKPGQASALADVFKKVIPVMSKADEFRGGRVLVDHVASFWTVVFESEVEDLHHYERVMSGDLRDEIRQVMGDYMNYVERGHREIYRIA